MLVLLPRTTGKFSRYGLKVNKMRYHHEGYTEQYLKGGEVTVAYNPEDVSSVWLLENGAYTEFTIIESRYEGMDLTAVQSLQTAQKAVTKGAERDNLQAQIDLARHIEAIVGCISRSDDVSIENIRNTREKEQNKQHRDFMKN